MEIKIPGSKSITNRLLILAALSKQKIEIKNVASSTDSFYLIEALKKLGFKIDQYKDSLTIEKDNSLNVEKNIYTHNAGTTTRFLKAMSTLLNQELIISGDKRMHQRPIKALTDALNQLGAKTSCTNGCPPIKILPQTPTGGTCKLPGNISSQYLSAILMASPFFKSDTTIHIEDDLCSKPYVDITLNLMEEFGLEVKNDNYKIFTIKGSQSPSPKNIYTVESDASSASYIGALSIILNKPIGIPNLSKKSLQGDIQFLDLLEKMGATIKEHNNSIKITPPEKLKSLGEIDMNHIPDLVMTFAVLAGLSKETTTITNIANLRIKECDRISALECELQKLGAKVKTGKDWIRVSGPYKIISNTEINTYEDHRIALAFGMLTSIFSELKIENPKVVEKSFKNFWEQLNLITNESQHN